MIISGIISTFVQLFFYFKKINFLNLFRNLTLRFGLKFLNRVDLRNFLLDMNKYLQHVWLSSEPSGQSLIPLQKLSIATHEDVVLHGSVLGGQFRAAHSVSSLLSPQSLSPSHTYLTSIQRLLVHVNCRVEHAEYAGYDGKQLLQRSFKGMKFLRTHNFKIKINI